jgi:hypothetical protein
MTAQEYIISILENLKKPSTAEHIDSTSLEETIYKKLMSKKFRKFSVPQKNQKIIKTALEKNVADKEPIQITWPFGGYKLWRLEESPETDWAELFTIVYIARWLKPVCALYQQGVTFTFWVDEVVINKMNNIPQSDLDAYQGNFASLLNFVKPFLPSNLLFEVFLERSQYENLEAFEKGLAMEMENLKRMRDASPKPLTDSAIQSIEMNVRLTPEQVKDPLWREKIDLMHYAYYNLQEKQNRIRPSYTTSNITAFSTFFEPNVIPIGTTKTSIVKFWVGIGALKKTAESYQEYILSPKQLSAAKFEWEDIDIGGLIGKNFKRIRILS